MHIKIKIAIVLTLACSLVNNSRAQLLSFNHLGIEEGMPSNITYSACYDSTGLLWISTNDGLISYDGSRIKQYMVETDPGLPSNVVGYLYCDSRNRIWICSDEGLALMDEQRRIKKINISDTIKDKNIDYCFEVEGLGIVASGSRKTYLLPENANTWIPFTWFDETIRKGKIIPFLKMFDKTSLMFIMGNKVMLVNLVTQKILTEINIENAASISRLNIHELLVTHSESFKLYKINIATSRVTKEYIDVKNIEGSKIQSGITNSDVAANGIVYFSTRSAGLVGFDVINEKFYQYLHQPLNPRSISFDNLHRVFCHPNGYMMASSSKGLNFTNVLTPMLQQLTHFIDDKGIITDGASVAGEDATGNIWLRSFDNLLIWNRTTNTVKNISPPKIFSISSETDPAIGGICRDNKNNMWVSYGGKGLFKFDGNGKLLHFFSKQQKNIPTNRIRNLRLLKNNKLIAATDDGLFGIDPETFSIDTFDAHPLLKPILKKRIVDIMENGDDIWFALSPRGAAYCYNFNTKKIRTITVKEGLSSDRVYCFGKDFNNNIYIGTFDGLNILSPEGKITIINKQSGLRHPRVENIVTDKQGRLWITNFNCLICYNPADKSFVYFDEQNGVSNSGFSLGENFIAKDGKIFFCNNGLLVADPSQPITQKKFRPQVSINRLYDDGGYDLLKPSSTIELNYNDAKLSLYYLTNTLITSNRFLFRYKMDKLDTGWQQPTKNNQVTYNLKPGKYIFHIQASSVEGGWDLSENSVSIVVLPPWWQRWWFRSIAAGLAILAFYLFYRRRINSIKTKATIKQQMAELEGKALRAQMNPHFIFNSLNAIQELIVTENYSSSYQYLSKFSKLLRMVLNNSEKNLIPLSNEIEMNQLYLELESLRFRQSFHYSIITDNNTDADIILFPSLLLQPFIENAIWHGLMHKEGEKKLFVKFSSNTKTLTCSIEDNGIGRVKAGEIKAKKLGSHHFESKGTELAQQRIELLRQAGTQATYEIRDLYSSNGEANGTLVLIIIPIHKIN